MKTTTTNSPHQLILRVLHEIYCWFSLCIFLPCYYYGGTFLFALQTVLGGGLACWMDWHISPTMKTNVQRIVDRKLLYYPPIEFLTIPTTQFIVLLNIYATIFTSEAITVGLVAWTAGFEATPRWDTRFLANMLLSIGFNELVFTLSHRYILHSTWGAWCHEIHHTCRPSCFSTSFTFHFWDSMTEFTLTHVAMAAFSHYFLKDPFSLLVTLQITYLWYSVADHSENLKLPHYFHHQWVNAHYSAYINYTPTIFKGQPDGVRTLLDEKIRKER